MKQVYTVCISVLIIGAISSSASASPDDDAFDELRRRADAALAQLDDAEEAEKQQETALASARDESSAPGNTNETSVEPPDPLDSSTEDQSGPIVDTPPQLTITI